MKTQKAANNVARPPRLKRERLQTSVLEELWSIWQADPRVPSVKSRHSWAIARNANPRLVTHWFLRRKACAKKAGQPISNDPYDMPLGCFEPPITPKRERLANPVMPDFNDAFPDLPSDDTFVYLADVGCSNNSDTSSDVAFDEDSFVESKRLKTPAYREFSQKVHHKPHKYSERESSSTNLDTFKDRYDNPFPICNQGRKRSNSTCVLCSSELTQDMAQSDSHMLFSSMQDPRLDFSSATLSELSAIPFLFRTPPAVPPDNAVGCKNVRDWSIVEDELSRLVHNGELDFSFLDVPHLSSMELID